MAPQQDLKMSSSRPLWNISEKNRNLLDLPNRGPLFSFLHKQLQHTTNIHIQQYIFIYLFFLENFLATKTVEQFWLHSLRT